MFRHTFNSTAISYLFKRQLINRKKLHLKFTRYSFILNLNFTCLLVRIYAIFLLVSRETLRGVDRLVCALLCILLMIGVLIVLNLIY